MARLLGVLVLILLGGRLLSLPLYPLIDRTESRYAEITRAMVVSGDVGLPHLHDAPFLGKPPLSIWMQAASAALLGHGEMPLRLPAWLVAFATLAAVMALGRRAGGDPDAGRRCGLVLVTCPLFFVMAGAVMTDPWLGAATALALLGLGTWTLEASAPSPRANRGVFLWLPLGLALGALSKGLVAFVPFGLAVPVLLCSAEGRALLRRFPFVRVGMILALLVVPWFAYAEARHPGYVRYFILGEHFSRFLEADWSGDRYGGTHPRPWGTIWVFLAAGALPWVLHLWRALRGLRSPALGTPAWRALPRPFRHTLLAMAFGPILLFTFAGSVLLTYPYPALLAMAVVLGLGGGGPLLAATGWRSPRSLRLCAAVGSGGFIVFTALVPAQWEAHVTQKHMVAGTAPRTLVYARDIRFLYSAAWYSRGRAVGVQGPDDPLWERVRRAPDDFLVITKHGKTRRIPPDLLARLQRRRTWGPYGAFAVDPGPPSTGTVATPEPIR